MIKKYKNLKEYTENEIKPQLEVWVSNIKETGLSLWLTQLANQLFWYILAYNITNYLNPIDEWIQRSSLNLMIIAFLLAVYEVLKDKFPEFIRDILKGQFFYKFGTQFNYWFASILISANMFILCLPKIEIKEKYE